MAGVTFDVTGIAEMQARLDALIPHMFTASAQAITTEAEAILAASRPLVPIDTGLMVSTGLLEGPYQSGTESSITISYGGKGLAPYTVLQHENTEYQHPNGGQHHFLSEPFYAATGGMLARLAASIRAQMEG
jgi:hypothetical protein